MPDWKINIILVAAVAVLYAPAMLLDMPTALHLYFTGFIGALAWIAMQRDTIRNLSNQIKKLTEEMKNVR